MLNFSFGLMIFPPVLGKMCAYPHDVENQQKRNPVKRDAKTPKSKAVSTHLWNTPLNLYQEAMKGFLS